MATTSSGQAQTAERWRLFLIFALAALGLLYLGVTLRRVQVLNTLQYADALEHHSMRRVRLPATRGRIMDRHGTIMADNRPSYCLALFVEELRERGAWSNTINAVDSLVDRLAEILEKPREITRSDIQAHIHRSRPLPLLAWRGMDERALALLAEHHGQFRGVDIYVLPERIYPLEDRAAHIIGYVGKGQPVTAETESENTASYDFYLPDLIGRHGVEQRYDAWLAGIPGGELIRVDAVGYKHESYPGRDPVAGKDVTLTIDAGWQAVAERTLKGLSGAVVVMDCRTGELLVMASSPRHNLADFVPFMPAAVWRRLLNDPGHPLLDRATSGIYAPGSIFKPVVALAALDAGIVKPDTKIDCPGHYELPNGRRVHCWLRSGHGPIALTEALEQSCNVYFMWAAVHMGYEPTLWQDCQRLGLGQRPKLELSAAAGLLPSDAWKRRRRGDGWRIGDTVNLSIGQGFISVTPLQMVVMTAALANGGQVLRPRIIQTPADPHAPSVIAQMDWSTSALRAVRLGMYEVIQSDRGSGRNARIEACSLAGKTGTAEYYHAGQRRKHAWMIAYGPFEQPRYAITVIVENSDSGGGSSAPVVHHIFSEIFGCEADPYIVPVIEAPAVPEEEETNLPDAGSTSQREGATEA